MVYVPSPQGFVLHMWNEVWVEGRWQPIDSTLGLGGTGAAHLILARTNLSSGTAFSSFLPVMEVMGKLTIEILEFSSGDPT